MVTARLASPDPTTDKPPRPRRRIPLSVRMFVAILLLTGLGGGLWVGVPIYRQESAMRQFQGTGGKFESQPRGPAWLADYIPSLHVVNRLFLNDTSVTDSQLVHLSGFYGLRELSLDHTEVSDVGLKHLQGLSELQDLSLNQTRVTDSGLIYLKSMTELQSLSLNHTSIEGSGLVQLRGLPNLRRLNIGRTQIANDKLIHVVGLTQLEELDLGGTDITDAGLVHLTGLPNLRRLVLRSVLADKRVTEAGKTNLRQAMPLLRISSGKD